MNGSASGNTISCQVKTGEWDVPVMKINGDGSVHAVFVEDGEQIYKTREQLTALKSHLKSSGGHYSILDKAISTLIEVERRWLYLMSHEKEMSM